MVKFPITEDMIFNYDRTVSHGRELIRAFVLTINKYYEDARSGENTIPYITEELLSSVYEKRYNEKPDEAMAKMLEVTAVYINDALRQAVREI